MAHNLTKAQDTGSCTRSIQLQISLAWIAGAVLQHVLMQGFVLSEIYSFKNRFGYSENSTVFVPVLLFVKPKNSKSWLYSLDLLHISISHWWIVHPLLNGSQLAKWKSTFPTCTCHSHKIYRDQAVGLKTFSYTLKITIFVNICKILGNFVKIWYFVNNCLIKVWI